MKDCILHTTLTKVALIHMASAMVPQSGLVKGNSFFFSINLVSKLSETQFSDDEFTMSSHNFEFISQVIGVNISP
jgi:hypothetical protein